jgi:ribonuclease BN (tRNA processing enzyme)
MSLRGGLGVLDGRAARLDDYFGVQRLPRRSEGSNESFSLLGRYRLTPFPTDHVRVARKFDWPSYGLALEDASTGRKAVYSGDTRFDPERMVPLLSGAHWTFHEVQLEAEPNPLHTSLAELRTLPAELRRRMLLYHYGDSWDAPGYDFVAQEFAGFARPQFRYVLFE